MNISPLTVAQWMGLGPQIIDKSISIGEVMSLAAEDGKIQLFRDPDLMEVIGQPISIIQDLGRRTRSTLLNLLYDRATENPALTFIVRDAAQRGLGALHFVFVVPDIKIIPTWLDCLPGNAANVIFRPEPEIGMIALIPLVLMYNEEDDGVDEV